MAKQKSWLPDNVTEWKDRHGKLRYRYRKAGVKPYNFTARPGTPEFMQQLAEARGGAPIGSRCIPRSMDDLALRMFASPRWLGMKPSSQQTYRRIIERYLARSNKKGQRYGTYPVKLAKVGTLERHIAELHETPAAANNLRKALKRLFGYAVKLEWIRTNPAALTDGFKEGAGWHTWTDEEIQRYRDYWANGTMARLAFELAMNTAARRCNLAQLERENLRQGRWEIAHVKDNDDTSVPITKEARDAIAAMPAVPIRFYITGQYGKPFTSESLGNRFRKWAREAGCAGPLHGIRKGVSRQLGEAGATTLEGRSITGHKTDRTFLRYAAKANRSTLADAAMGKMVGKPDLANRQETEQD